VRVLYEGMELYTHELVQVLLSDLAFVAASVCFIGLYMWSHLGSAMLMLVGLLAMALSFPVVFFFFTTVAQHAQLSLLNVVSFWIVLGIGADDIFIFHETWARSATLLNAEPGSGGKWGRRTGDGRYGGLQGAAQGEARAAEAAQRAEREEEQGLDGDEAAARAREGRDPDRGGDGGPSSGRRVPMEVRGALTTL
jgi:hypothetical protein